MTGDNMLPTGNRAIDPALKIRGLLQVKAVAGSRLRFTNIASRPDRCRHLSLVSDSGHAYAGDKRTNQNPLPEAGDSMVAYHEADALNSTLNDETSLTC
jgi:hypothetical protein